MLQGQLYDIVSQDGTLFELCFHADHPIYKAHFPNNPITPGVCFVQIAQELFSIVYSQPIENAVVSSLKLLAIHSPNLRINAYFEIKNDKKVQVKFNINNHIASIITFNK